MDVKWLPMVPVGLHNVTIADITKVSRRIADRDGRIARTGAMIRRRAALTVISKERSNYPERGYGRLEQTI